MPEICRFYGIVILFHWNEHPPPHFHAIYGRHEASVNINDGSLRGRFPTRARRLVLEWLDLHREELLENWTLARQRIPLNRIAPLD